MQRHQFQYGLLSLLTLLTLAAIGQHNPTRANTRTFQIRFTKSVHAKPFTGRVYVIFSRRNPQPRTGPSWFNPEQFVARDVKNWKPGVALDFSGQSPSAHSGSDGFQAGPILGYPGPLSKMKLAGFHAQAIARFNPHHREIGVGPGNGFSQPVQLGKDDSQQQVELEISKLVAAKPFAETNWSKLLQVPSKLLSTFYKRPVSLKAAVLLPASYFDQPKRRYPVILTIPGFGGTHHGASRRGPVPEDNDGRVEFLRLVLDPSCPLGHHVFADSANNGPVGQALTTELIAALDQQFRTIPKPTARFLTGHSSGGWSSLWLQVTYPDVFGGTWSTAPDPVDFRDFQQIDLYRKGENMYVDAQGKRRPLARINGRVMLWYQGFADMEWVLGYGGQLHSFEAAFSRRGKDGKPQQLWDRKSGQVDLKTATTWEQYDIRLVLQRNWKTLAPRLKGKLHVFMGSVDTFYLEGATIRLKQTLAELGSDAVVEIHEDRDHFNLLRGGLSQRIRKEMTSAFLKAHPDQRRPAAGR